MTDHRYILELYEGMNTRYRCPGCGKNRVFARYVDTHSGEHLADYVGRCNRESNCGYHYTPKEYFKDNPDISCNTLLLPFYSKSKYSKAFQPVTHCNTQESVTPVTPSFIPFDTFKASLTGYNENHFVTFLAGLFGAEVASRLIARYYIGTSKHWPGSTVFWQIDSAGKIRAGKIMLYANNGHRVTEPFNHITWVHKALLIDNYILKQCLFSEHLLKGNTLPVAIVESEKTAIIASIYLPQFIWLACGSLTGLSVEKCQVLKGRTVALFPDVKGFEKWNEKAIELSRLMPGTRFRVSGILERAATEIERLRGLDIADYLIRYDYKTFTEPEALPTWYVDMSGILQQYRSGAITGDQFLSLQDGNRKQSGLTMADYVSQVKRLSVKKTII